MDKNLCLYDQYEDGTWNAAYFYQHFQKYSKWMKAPKPPSSYLKIIRLNDNELMAIIGAEYWRYNNKTDLWKLWEISLSYSYANTCCIDHKHKSIWIITDDQIIKINLHNNTTKEWMINEIDTGVGSSYLIINDALHIIGGSDNTKHLRLISNYKEPEIMYDFRINQIWGTGNYFHQSIYIKSSNEILVFGGFDLGFGVRSKSILRYSIDSNEWRILKKELPLKMSSFGCVITNDELQVLIFGGATDEGDLESIYILTLETMTFRESKMKCPKAGTYDAVLLCEEMKDNILVQGFIRNECNVNDKKTPIDIVNFIMKWSAVEYIHVISQNNEHWKAKLNDILDLGKSKR